MMSRQSIATILTAVALVLVSWQPVRPSQSPAMAGPHPGVWPPGWLAPLAGMPPVIDPVNLYSETAAGKLSSAVAGALPRVYVPLHGDNAVDVIDPVTLKVVDHFQVGDTPQHAVPSWDLKTLWVANNANYGRHHGSVTPIDPLTGKPGKSIDVSDPYNMYFMPDGSAAIIVNEARRRLEFRDPHTMALLDGMDVPDCGGINHADFAIDGSYAIFSCEFNGSVTKLDLVNKRVLGTLELSRQGASMHQGLDSTPRHRGRRHRHRGGDSSGHSHSRGMPQDVRISPDGTVFYVADMIADGVYLVDGDAFQEIGFIPTGVGAHGFCVSRDGKKLYVSNRGSHSMPTGSPGGKGSVSVIDFATRKVEALWVIPDGGSPDMGNVSADGRQLWFSGRFDDVVYMFDTTTGAVTKIPVGHEPHGLTVWPQPGRYSLGHTGNLR